MTTQKLNFFRAIILNPQDDSTCDYFPDGLLVIEHKGKEAKIKDLLSFEEGLKKYKALMSKKNTIDFKNAVIMPGFFDMHFHWVQDDVRQMPKDSLLDWLEKYTFPAEERFKNKAYAKSKAKHFFKKLLSGGTVGGACFSSIHEHALNSAMKEAKGHFVIGNVLMNMNSPKKLTQNKKESLELTKKFIKKYKKRFCFTPRFAISTDPAVMQKGSHMADKAGCFKQTHLSETPQEIKFVLDLYRQIPGFEKVKSYTEIYYKTGMLGKRSLMGHGIHLASHELNLLKKTKTSLIHCPTSNAPIKEQGLGSGLFDFKKIEKAKISWALGSDIGGGPYLSMFDVMRSFVDQNQKLGIQEATFTKALYRSTLAGASILGLQKQCGNLDKGKIATFIVVPLTRKKKPKTAEELIKSMIKPLAKKRDLYDDMSLSVFLNGKQKFSHSSSSKTGQ